MRFRAVIPVSIFTVFLLVKCFTPRKSFDKYVIPAAPDYALEKNWAALPTMKDSADAVPANSGLKDGQADAKVDVFFIHPTMYYKAERWNASLDDAKTNAQVDRLPIRQQASIFNGSCKVYAPRYRQATLFSFLDPKGNGQIAIDSAYNDVRNAFLYYLKHYNNGRPLIIAGHSQGSFHGYRLLKEFFDNDPALRKRLVAAYLPGGNLPVDAFQNIPAGDSASQTGCYIAWHCREWGSSFNEPNARRLKEPAYENWNRYLCVNPLTWKRDSAYAPASLNLGSVPMSFDRIDKGIADAQRSPQAIIWVHRVSGAGYSKAKNYHPYDFNLFWMNVRENVRLRVEIYLRGK